MDGRMSVSGNKVGREIYPPVIYNWFYANSNFQDIFFLDKKGTLVYIDSVIDYNS
jgi:hypothetical protein